MRTRRADTKSRLPARGRPRKGGRRTRVRLAVFHATPDVEAHVAALRRVGHFRVVCLPQRSQAARSSPVADAVLWELTPEHKPDRRRIQALARRTPVVSYSASSKRNFSKLSRVTGFISHLRAPLVTRQGAWV